MTDDTAEPWCPIPDTRDRSVPPPDVDYDDEEADSGNEH